MSSEFISTSDSSAEIGVDDVRKDSEGEVLLQLIGSIAAPVIWLWYLHL